MKTKCTNLRRTLSLVVALLFAPTTALRAATPVKPNVAYLMADDLGWSDISTHPDGSIPTPNIDRLFKQGVELRNFMGWCVCSPTRAMLLNGRHPFRVGTGPETGGELAKEETTIAEGFKANGYRTGIFGKWHNGDDPDTPEFRAAFEEAFAGMPNKKFKGGHGVNEHGFVFKGGKPGTYTVYLDNLRLRHANGRTTPIWTNGKDTRFRKIEDSARFTNVRVRPLPAAQVGKQLFPTH